MDRFQILHATGDYFSLQTRLFEGDAAACARAREAFMAAPGVLSFEVTPFPGKVAIGFDRTVMLDEAASREAMRLLLEYLPGLVASDPFKQRYHQAGPH